MKKIIIGIIILCIFTLTIFAQQIIIVDIKNFFGCITNADIEDIPQENFVELKNLRPVNGKLVKTFEFGINDYPVKPTTFSTLYNLVEYINPYLINPTGYDPLLYAVTSTDSAYVVYWNSASNSWVYFSFDEGLIHNQATNPVVQADGVIRFLPGAIGMKRGLEAKGMWIGYIDTTWVFDHNYQRSGSFECYHSGLDSLGISVSLEVIPTKLDSGTFEDTKYYKYSLVYDGVQEGLLRDLCNINYQNKQFGKIDLQIANYHTFDEMNNRITAMNIYRSDDVNGIYNKIHTIDFLRDSTEVIRPDSLWNGAYYVYIPELSDYTFNPIYSYIIGLEEKQTNSLYIYNPGNGLGKTIFKDSLTNQNDKKRIIKNLFNIPYNLYQVNGATVTKVRGNTSRGAYCGQNLIFINKNVSNNTLGKGILQYSINDSTLYRYILSNYTNIILTNGDSLKTDTIRTNTIKIVSPAKGNYYFKKKNGTFTTEYYSFFDTGLTEGEEHPLEGEVSIKVNGQYAKIIGNRLWQGNIVLDPGGKNEVHTDWISYSEIGQYDVNPVSNVISFANQGLGEITGIAELFGYPVIIKKNNISLINIKDYPIEPAKWNIIESVHNIGNISTNGILTVLGHIYLPYYDGIYEFAPSDIAPSSTTPTRILKITEPIDDKYLALTLTQKQAIISEYNQKYNEIIFKLGNELWAYSLLYKSWRELDIIGFTPTYWCLDQNANILAYSGGAFYNSDSLGNARAYLKSKTFSIYDETGGKPLQSLYLTFKGHVSAGLQFKVYPEYSSIAKDTITIATTDSIQTVKYPIKIRAKKFYFELLNPSYSTYETEIYRIKITGDIR